ncbi:hypothetical protein J6590_006731 [Homalodisca vitripennis]|nr:hypothetical protein J6590_006731 [Homalodisca vitripennis]
MAQAQQLQTGDLCKELQANTDKQQPRACTVRHAPASHHTVARRSNYRPVICVGLQANTDKQQPRACTVRHAPCLAPHRGTGADYRPVICVRAAANTDKQQPRACTVSTRPCPTTPWHRRSNYRPTRAPASHHTVAQAQQLQTGDLCKELQANTDKQQPRACTVRHAPLPRTTPWHRRSNYRPVICVRSCKPTPISNNHELTRAPASHHTVAQAQQLQTGDLCKELQANTDKQQPRACTVRHAPLPRTTPWHRRSNYRPVICVRSCKPTLTSNNHELVPSDTRPCLAPHRGTGAATTDR